MTRREWLTRVIGGVAAAAVAPLIDLTDMTPSFWNQPAIKALKPWRVKFPDGVVYSFDAAVLSEKIHDPIDGFTSIELTLQPTGPLEIETEPPATTDPDLGQGVGVSVSRDGMKVGELIEIQPPTITRNMFDVSSPLYDESEQCIPGLQRMGPMTLSFTRNEETS